MANTRKKDNKIVGDSLDAFTRNLAQLYADQLTIRNTELEGDFQGKVADGGLSLDDQLEYRKAQLKEVQDDPAERARLRGEISTLKTRITQEKFTQDYAAKLAEFQSGMASIDSVISFLTTARSNTNDTAILDKIASDIATAQEQKFTITQNVIKNQTEYASKSNAVEVIDAQISKVSAARAQAVISGNDEQVSVLDLQLQNLKQAKTDQQVQKQVLELGAVSTTGAVDAISLLNTLNSNISSASNTSGPVTVGGNTYASVADFWTTKRDTYLSDQSTNGFFGSLDQELKNNISTLNSKNALTTEGLATMTSVFNQLGARPELAAYTKQIDTYKQDVTQTGANALTDTITNKFVRDLDIGSAVASLNNLKGLGVNVDSAYTKILQSAATTKSQQVSNILSAAQAAMTNDPSLTPEVAIQKAVAAGAGTVLSPDQAATKSEGAIATDTAKTAAAGAGTNDPRTTVPATPTAANPAGAPGTKITPAQIAALPALTPGTNSADVKMLQNYLIQEGYDIQAGATGLYGPQTQAAVTAFQTKNNIDTGGNAGFFGPKTKAFLTSTQSTTPTTAQPAATPAPVATPAPAAAAPVAPAPSKPAPTPQPSSASGYTFNKRTDGNVEIFQGGQRVSTSSLDYAKSLGFTG